MITFAHITESYKKILKRFPLTIAFGWLGTIVAMILVESPDWSEEGISALMKLLMISGLGVLLHTSLSLFLEQRKEKYLSQALTMFGLGTLIVYYLFLPGNLEGASPVFLIRYFLFMIAALLTLTVAPFLKKDHINGYWQYSKGLFVRFFVTGLFMGILYAGIALAMASSDFLLDIEFREETYFHVWVFVVGVLSIPFYLAGISEKTESLEKKTDYPKGIKVFSQYILTPLLILYMVILYAYLGRILITGVWPEGMVSYLILTLASAGLFTYFLLYPQLKESHWFKWFTRLFFAALIPILFMLFAAIWIRLAEYGLTESRYYVIVLGIWFLGMSLYFLISQKRNLKLISISLFFITLLSSFGPWGSMYLSEVSQFNRLEAALIRNDMLAEGELVEPSDEVSFEDRAIISGTVDYLYSEHGIERMQPWFEEDISDIRCDEYRYGATCIVARMGIAYLSRWSRSVDDEGEFPVTEQLGYYDSYSSNNVPILVTGYDYFVEFSVGRYGGPKDPMIYQMGDNEYRLELSQKNLKLYKNDRLVETFDMSEVIEPFNGKYDTFEFGDLFFESDGVKIIFRSMNGVKLSDDELVEYVDRINGVLLIRE